MVQRKSVRMFPDLFQRKHMASGGFYLFIYFLRDNWVGRQVGSNRLSRPSTDICLHLPWFLEDIRLFKHINACSTSVGWIRVDCVGSLDMI